MAGWLLQGSSCLLNKVLFGKKPRHLCVLLGSLIMCVRGGYTVGHHLHCACCMLHLESRTLWSVSCILPPASWYPSVCIVRPAACVIHPEPYNLHPATHILHPIPYILHPASSTLHPPSSSVLHSASFLLHPSILQSALHTLQPVSPILHLAVLILHHFTLCLASFILHPSILHSAS